MSIGKKRLLRFEPGATLRSRITDTAVIVVLPPNLPSYSDPAQLSAKKAIRRSLKKEADECLPIRLSAMAARYDFAYNNLKNKSMHSRWGSCTNRGDITLSIYLMMMPWEMITCCCMNWYIPDTFTTPNPFGRPCLTSCRIIRNAAKRLRNCNL